jgi:hypothetical protein
MTAKQLPATPRSRSPWSRHQLDPADRRHKYMREQR